MIKLAVIVFTDLNESHDAKARVVNALQIVQELQEAGDDVTLLFDGAGVVSVATIADPDHALHAVYQKVKPKIAGACAYCAKAFHVKDQIEMLSIPLLSDYKQHPSVRSLLVDGYQVITL
ncbi:MAG: DsrE family protein [Anaerolineae bacterium]